MKQLYLITIATLFCGHLNSQGIAWAKNIETGYQPRVLLSDSKGNAVIICSAFESAMFRFSPTGQALPKVQYPLNFVINDIVHDGNKHFYSCGNIVHGCTINGNMISTKGNGDGFVAKMDEDGKIIWIRTFGSSGEDKANGLTLSADKTNIIVTGSIADSLYVENVLTQSFDQRSMLLISFDTDGHLVQHLLTDFLATKNIGNIGYEIVTANSGNYFLLADREGKSWANDTTFGEEDGHYIFHLDKDLNTLWSRFVVNSACYYGYNCGQLSTANDEAYIPWYCESKYGGTGRFERYQFYDQPAKWTKTIPDGGVHDTYSDGKNVFYVATEDAYICPCPDGRPGNGVVRMLDENNNDILMCKSENTSFTHITTTHDGVTYVFGFCPSDYTDLGGSSLTSGQFLMKIGQPRNTAFADHNETASFGIVPNPSSGHAQILFGKQFEGTANIRVINLLGQQIMEQHLNPSQQNFMHVLHFDPSMKGSFFIEVTNGQAREVKKIVVQ
jgi:hypothetical protein